MPRKPRFYLPGVPAHIVQRGNCRQAVFFKESDYSAYLGWLVEGAEKHGCALHAYVLMTNHVHLLVTPDGRDSISRLIQFVGRHYVTYVNHRYRKSGTLWEGRHKGCIISSDDYLLACMRYIELNPVRAGMVNQPIDYRWSSYHENASGGQGTLIKPHPLYEALGASADARGAAYRVLCQQDLGPERLRDLRETVQTGTPLGSNLFRAKIEQVLSRRVGQARRGRPGNEGKGY